MSKEITIWQKLIRSELIENLSESFLSEFAEPLFSGRLLRSSLLGYLCDFSKCDVTLNSALAVELVHSASLLHDDVIDGAFFRRHAETLWKQKGIPASILSGDYLVTLAFGRVVKTQNFSICTQFSESLQKVCALEAKQDLESETDKTIENAVEIAEGKTGELFGFAAFASTTDSSKAQALYEAGLKLGTAYQLADDLADAFGIFDEIGKTLGTDETSGKVTILSAGATFDEARQIIQKLIDEALSLFDEVGVLQNVENYLKDLFYPAIERLIGAKND